MSESKQFSYIPNILTVDTGSSPKSVGLGGGYPSGSLSTNASELIFEGGNSSAGGRLVLDENGVVLAVGGGADLKINNQIFPTAVGTNGQILTVTNAATGQIGWQDLGGGTTIKALSYTYATLFG